MFAHLIITIAEIKRAGYAQLLDLVTLDLQVMQDLTGSGELLVCHLVFL
jgi:hypothetical protein